MFTQHATIVHKRFDFAEFVLEELYSIFLFQRPSEHSRAINENSAPPYD
jgi:hypothetical protein